VLQNAVKHTYSSLGFQNFSGGNTPGAPAYKGRGGEGREGREGRKERGEEGGKGPHNNVCLRAPTNLNPALGATVIFRYFTHIITQKQTENK